MYSLESPRWQCHDEIRKKIPNITKTRLYSFDPLKPHFYSVKLGFTGVYINVLLISAQKHRLWVLVRTASPKRFKQVPTIYVLSRNMKSTRIFHPKVFNFLVVKFSIYLNRRVFVMLLVILSNRNNFVGTQKRVRISHDKHGKRAIGVRAIEVRL